MLFLISFLGISTYSFATPACKTLNVNDYKKIIELKQKSDPLLPKLPQDASFDTTTTKNCYVTVTVMPVKSNYEYWLNYQFDPNSELVNVVPSAGPDVMTCNDNTKKSVEYFAELLAQKRAKDLGLPSAFKNPKKPSLLIFFCNVHYFETAQDDISKPLIYRKWIFDRNGNIVEYGEVKRYSKIYKD